MIIRLQRVARLAMLAISLCVGGAHAAGTPWGPDVPGAKDHPLIKRFTGSWLVGYKQADWDQTRMPLGMATDNTNKHIWKQAISLEGKITQVFYLAPQGKTLLEVHRNYEQALKSAGLQTKFSCEQDCSDLYYAMSDTTHYADGVRWVEGAGIPDATTSATYPINMAIGSEGSRLLYGTLNKAGQTLHVLLYTSVAATTDTRIAGTYLQIVEPKTMQTGQVTVDAKALQSGLASEGKVALYGIYFDTGKAEIKPESKAQMDQMAKLLQSQPALKVYIVGHTDNQGSLDANLGLSQQRAQAVASALSNNYKIDARRMQARGVANLAPVTTNANEEGRGRNRRVELIAQ